MPIDTAYRLFSVEVIDKDGKSKKFGAEVGSGQHTPQSLATNYKKFDHFSGNRPGEPTATRMKITGHFMNADQSTPIGEIHPGMSVGGTPDDTIEFDYTVNPPAVVG